MAGHKEAFFEEAIKNRTSHRLCIDFSHPGGIKDFMAKAKASGILDSECEPICIFTEGESSVWLVGRRKAPSIIQVN